MTRNQIEYWSLQERKQHNAATRAETERSNRAREAEATRSNTANEAETKRANLAREMETSRSNLAKEQETFRHNREQERVAIGSLNETIRHNTAYEEEAARHNAAVEYETYRSNLAREAETYRSNVRREQQTDAYNRAYVALQNEQNRIAGLRAQEEHRSNLAAEQINRDRNSVQAQANAIQQQANRALAEHNVVMENLQNKQIQTNYWTSQKTLNQNEARLDLDVARHSETVRHNKSTENISSAGTVSGLIGSALNAGSRVLSKPSNKRFLDLAR